MLYETLDKTLKTKSYQSDIGLKKKLGERIQILVQTAEELFYLKGQIIKIVHDTLRVGITQPLLQKLMGPSHGKKLASCQQAMKYMCILFILFHVSLFFFNIQK